jgi:RimJ/RimL family protein N-acetyltransferase
MWLHVYDDNRRAVRSYEKSGFVREGVLRHHTCLDRQFKDVLAMAILRDEWSARRAATPFPAPWTPRDLSPRPPPAG